MRHGVSLGEAARVFGISKSSIEHWVTRFRASGLKGLEPQPSGAPAHRDKRETDPRREAVKALRSEHPEYGTRRIRDVLARFEALGVSETEVRRILHKEGLIPETRPPRAPREHPERRFERAEPNQLWQSDIFTFLLRRHERVYVTAFMDDHSRFVVAHAVAHHQRSALVLEALERGIAAYGPPREILTDQGRQYTAWRGTTDFEQTLRRYGIRHIKSRPQHPQTLGKVERFWKTLWDEFLSRTVFADFADCLRRLQLFIDGYNFQRPHQGLAGLVPADRFFRAAPQVRAAVERAVESNALQLAQQKPPRKPFYLVGRFGDRDLSIAASGSGLHVQLGSETETIRMPKEETDDEQTETARRFAAATSDAEAAAAADAEMAVAAEGPGGGGAEALPDGAHGALGGEAGDGGDWGAADLAGDLLPAGGAGTEGDAAGAVAWSDGGWDGGGELHGADRGAGGEVPAAGAGQAPDGAVAAAHAQSGEAGAGGDGSGEAAAVEGPALDERWNERFAELDAADGDARGDRDADPDAWWRDAALRWERKLAGADAASDDGGREGVHDEQELHGAAGDPAVGARPLPDGAGGLGEKAHGERGGGAAGAFAAADADAGAPGDGGSAGGDDWGEAGPAAAAGEGGGAGGGEPAAAEGERAADGASRHGGPAASRGVRSGAGAGEDAAGEAGTDVDLDAGDGGDEGGRR
jgi:transposase InsO family protein